MKASTVTLPASLRVILFGAMLGIVLMLSSLQAQNTTWTGTVSSDWGNPSNWSTGAMPTGDISVDLPVGSSTHIINVFANEGSKYFEVKQFTYYDNSNGYTINIQGASQQNWATLNILGQGVTNATSDGQVQQFRPTIFNIGNNAELQYTYTGSMSMDKTGGQSWVRLTGSNSVLTVNTAIDPVPTSATLPKRTRLGFLALEAVAGSTVNVTNTELHFGQNMSYPEGLVIAGNIIAKNSVLVSRGATANSIIIISGSNSFIESPDLDTYRDADGFLTTSNVNTTEDPTKGNTINLNINRVENGVLRVDSNWGSVRVARTDFGNATSTIGLRMETDTGAENACLAGSGTVGTVIFETGRVSPGDGYNNTKTGKLTGNGHYEQRGGTGINATTGAIVFNRAMLYIDLGKGTQDTDMLYITGSAIIGANSQLYIEAPNASILPGTYVFLHAEKGITGTFSDANAKVPTSLTVESGQVTISPDGKDMGITVTQKRFSDVVGLSQGQLAIAGYLDAMYEQVAQGPDALNPDAYEPVIGTLNAKSIYTFDTVLKKQVFDPAATLKLLGTAINQLSPQAYGHIYEGAVASMNTMADNVVRRVDAPIAKKDAGRSMLYATFNYDTAKIAETLDYEPAKLKTFYYTVGGERNFGQNLTMGAAFTMGDGRYELDKAGSNTDGTNYIVNLYGAWRAKNYTIGALVTGGSDKYKTKRDVAALKLSDYVYSENDGQRYGAGLWVNRVFKARWIDTKPYAGVLWMNWSMDGLQESGPSSITLATGDQKQDIIQSRLGVRFESMLFARNMVRNTFHFYLDAAWLSILKGADSRTINSTLNGYNMDIRTPEMEKNGVRGSAGVMIWIGKHLAIDIGASGQTDAGLDTQYGYTATIGWRF